ncbi:sulfite exporter TauE/SafE family protein [Pseudonocardia xishanensis]|uniref:Probable membrane transporter protein n=1 Tax=Pseudonocardia xishanensis TaxID=630995 RepID=A0ABP8RQS1_9PSEU
MSLLALLPPLGLGLVMGVVIGGFGGGGGVLTVPALVYLLGQSAQAATTGSLIIVGIAAAAGGLGRIRGHGVDWRTGIGLGVAGIPTAYLGSLLNHRVSQTVLLLAFAGLTLVAATAMLLNSRGEPAAVEPVETPSAGPARSVGDTVTACRARLLRSGSLQSVAKVAGVGAGVGFLTGFLGVGGGFLIIPALVIVLRMPMATAVGTSLLVITLNSVSSMLSRAGALDVDWRVIAPFTIAAVLGTVVGKRIADRLSGEVLTRAFAVLLLAVGLGVGVQSLLSL